MELPHDSSTPLQENTRLPWTATTTGPTPCMRETSRRTLPSSPSDHRHHSAAGNLTDAHHSTSISPHLRRWRRSHGRHRPYLYSRTTQITLRCGLRATTSDGHTPTTEFTAGGAHPLISLPCSIHPNFGGLHKAPSPAGIHSSQPHLDNAFLTSTSSEICATELSRPQSLCTPMSPPPFAQPEEHPHARPTQLRYHPPTYPPPTMNPAATPRSSVAETEHPLCAHAGHRSLDIAPSQALRHGRQSHHPPPITSFPTPPVSMPPCRSAGMTILPFPPPSVHCFGGRAPAVPMPTSDIPVVDHPFAAPISRPLHGMPRPIPHLASKHHRQPHQSTSTTTGSTVSHAVITRLRRAAMTITPLQAAIMVPRHSIPSPLTPSSSRHSPQFVTPQSRSTASDRPHLATPGSTIDPDVLPSTISDKTDPTTLVFC